MRLHIGPRQSGKTTALLEWLRAGPDRYVVVHSQFEAYRLSQLVIEYPDLFDKIITVDELISKRILRGKRNAEIAIDNLDLVLPQLIGSFSTTIGPITYTGDFSYGS